MRRQPRKSPSSVPVSLEVDLAARVVKRKGEEVKLTATEYNLLRLFVQHAGKVLTHRQILREVWGPNSVEQTHYLRVYLAHLREKLEANPAEPELLITEPGVGYRLISKSSCLALAGKPSWFFREVHQARPPGYLSGVWVIVRPVPPHPNPLPEEREPRRPRWAEPGTLLCIARLDTTLPSPQGRGPG